MAAVCTFLVEHGCDIIHSVQFGDWRERDFRMRCISRMPQGGGADGTVTETLRTGSARKWSEFHLAESLRKAGQV